MSKTVPSRSEIAVEHTWDAASVFESGAAWEAERAHVAGELSALARFQGHLGDGPAALAEWLETADRVANAVSKVYLYASMFHNVDTADQAAAAQHDRAERGEALTADGMIALMADLFAEGYGGEVQLERERVGITWGQFSTHLYSNFYVYQYATGISAAHALAVEVLAGAPDAAERYLAFLKAGGSLYPLDALKLAGVDMTTPEPVEQTFAVFAQLVDRLERLIDRR